MGPKMSKLECVLYTISEGGSIGLREACCRRRTAPLRARGGQLSRPARVFSALHMDIIQYRLIAWSTFRTYSQ